MAAVYRLDNSTQWNPHNSCRPPSTVGSAQGMSTYLSLYPLKNLLYPFVASSYQRRNWSCTSSVCGHLALSHLLFTHSTQSYNTHLSMGAFFIFCVQHNQCIDTKLRGIQVRTWENERVHVCRKSAIAKWQQTTWDTTEGVRTDTRTSDGHISYTSCKLSTPYVLLLS